jgi:cardiolipin synthase A/B
MQILARQTAFAPRPQVRFAPRPQREVLGDGVDLNGAQAPIALAKPTLQEAAPSKKVDLEKLITQVLSDPEAEKKLIDTLQFLNATKQLKPALQQLAGAAVESGTLPPMPKEKVDALVNQASGMIDAQFREHGMTPDTQGAVYVGWPELSAQHLSAVRSTQAPPRMAGALSLLTDKTFLSELEALQGAKFRDGNSVKPLIDGPASFAERDRMIDNAKDSIHLLSWAIYDDQTGWDTVRKLADRKSQGIDVKVIVDGQVSHGPHHDAPMKFLEENGVPVIRWRDADRPYDGNHRKMMLVDGKEAVVGGINIGDVYSHKYGETKWRDTDILIQGPAVDDGVKMFADLWNEQAKSHGQVEMAVPEAKGSVVGNVRSAVVNHVPGPEGDAHITLATMKAIEGATESVDIENAYFINTPGLKDVLLKALNDGVKVRLLTNSSESIDEPLISGPILSSLPDLVAAGAEVYLKKGDTLHSKFMTVDGIFSSVGSHNHHPRSQRFEGEMVVNSLDSNLAASLTSSFEDDISKAQRIEKAEDIVIPQSPFNILAMRYFYDAL